MLRQPTTQQAVINAQMAAFKPSPFERPARKSWAYYRGVAFTPEYGASCDSPYVEWDEPKAGPRPRVTKLAQIIVDSSAEFLFSDPPRFTLSGHQTKNAQGQIQPDLEAEALQEAIEEIIEHNGLIGDYVPLARAAGNEGGVWFRFGWEPTDPKCPVQIDTFSPYQVTAIRNPLNARYLEKLILKFKFSQETEEGCRWFWYREDWTATEYTRYELLETTEHDDSAILRYAQKGQWPIDSEASGPNRFGLIPWHYIYNRKTTGDYCGIGDLWDIYPELNQLSHTAWLQHRSNQRDGDPTTVIINADTYPNTITNGDVVAINGSEGTDMKLLVPENNLREWMRQYAQDLERELLDAVGGDRANPEEITNKGNLTSAVKEFVFQRSVKTTMEKRVNWGCCGLEPFLKMMLIGLSRLPEQDKKLVPELAYVNEADPETYDLCIHWQPLFRVTPEELTQIIDNMAKCVSSGFLTRERAVGVVADALGIDDVSTLLSELSEAIDRLDAMEEAALTAAEAAAQPQDNSGGSNANN